MSVYLTVQLISTIDPGPKYLSLSLLPYTLVSELETTTTHSDGTATVATLLHLILVLGEILSSHTAELVICLLTPGTSSTLISVVSQSRVGKRNLAAVNTGKVLSRALSVVLRSLGQKSAVLINLGTLVIFSGSSLVLSLSLDRRSFLLLLRLRGVGRRG